MGSFGFLKRLSMPDNFPMWFGVGAGITGLFLLLDSGWYWYWQLLLIVSVIFIGPIIVQLFNSLSNGADNVLTVYPGKQHIGQNITLEKEIKGGAGETVLQGETWAVQGDDLNAGTRVKIVAVKKNILYVVSTMKAFDEEVETPPVT
ncbi:MAG: NfeD family protein [Cocleimonas sp.]|nr:NfeD family protein [Cocleimonas sp.]